MATEYPPADGNPYRFGVEGVYFFDGAVVVPPPGTMAPPRPPGMERVPLPPGTVRGWEYVEVGGEAAILPPPGTMAPPRPPGMERRLRPPVGPSATAAQPEPDVPTLVARIESALETIHAALAEIKRLQAPPQGLPQSKAG